MKGFADDKINATETDKFAVGWVENIVETEENTGCLKSEVCNWTDRKHCGKRRKCWLIHYHTIPHFDALKTYSCENIVRKGEIACNKQFLPSHNVFYPI